MRLPYVVLLVAAAMVMGFFMALPADRKVETQTETVTVTKVVEKEVIVTKPLPEVCLKSQEVLLELEEMDAASTAAMGEASIKADQATKAIVAGTILERAAAIEDMNRAKAELGVVVADKMTRQSYLGRLIDQCTEEVNK